MENTEFSHVYIVRELEFYVGHGFAIIFQCKAGVSRVSVSFSRRTERKSKKKLLWNKNSQYACVFRGPAAVLGVRALYAMDIL